MALAGADRTAALMLAWAGGRAAVGVVDSQPQAPTATRITFRPTRVSRLLGADIPPDEQRALLERVEIATEVAGEGAAVPIMAGQPGVPLGPDEAASALVAVVPSHRRDLAIEADIAEEVARVRGYETLPGRLPDTTMPAYRPDRRRALDDLRAILAGAGLVELVTHGLIGPQDHARLGHRPGDSATIRAANPVTLDHSELRRSLLPEHLRVIVDNERQRDPDVHAFEIGTLHAWEGAQPMERVVLGIVLAGREQPLTHDRPGTSMDVATAKGLLELLASRVVGVRLAYEPVVVREGIEHPGRTAAVAVVAADGTRRVVGRVGELHPRLLEAAGVRAPHVAFAEIELEPLLGLRPERERVGRLEGLPGMERDIALVVSSHQRAGDLEAVIREQGGPHLRSVRLFDMYAGPPLDPDERSLAYRLRFEAVDGELTEGDVEAAVEQVVGVLSERLGARLRA